VVNGFINSSEILNYLNFCIPQCQTRSTYTFYTQLHRKNYLINAPINRLMRLTYDTQVDLFNFNSIESHIIIILLFMITCELCINIIGTPYNCFYHYILFYISINVILF